MGRISITFLAKNLVLVFIAAGTLYAQDTSTVTPVEIFQSPWAINPEASSIITPAVNADPPPATPPATPPAILPAMDPDLRTIRTRYVTITYWDVKALRKFNNKLYMGNLKYLLKGKKSDTIEDEVKNKIDLIVEKVETVLDMYPATLRFNIVIHGSTRGVQESYQRLYNRTVNYIAFYSPGENTVFYSADHSKLRVVTHEIGHVIAENYFAISPPPKIHEVLAQYAEAHIND